MKALQQITRSMLWAAYGDALGFITELADERILKSRTGATKVEGLIPWRRRIGGRFGVDVDMPAGCYSDDTQLRLATCRCIASDGWFDVDSFAKVELTVWRSYALGAGISSKAAARNLAKLDVQWCGNFFTDRDAKYTNGGGNGAAMRIQPHVWSAGKAKRESDVLRPILRNAIITHGHPRGFLGAAFHGLCLAYAIREEKPAGPKEWRQIADNLRYVPKIIELDDDLKTFWIGPWEREAGRPFQSQVEETVGELHRDIETLVQPSAKGGTAEVYADGVRRIGALDRKNVGSGTKTALLASFLAYLCAESPASAFEIASNLLGSDTDSIATMAGAIVGAIVDKDPPQVVADQEYLRREAERMHAISTGKNARTFPYPDLLNWKAPRTEIDCVGQRDGEWYLAGLGRMKPCGREYIQPGKSAAIWQWFDLEFGQRVLLKRRSEPKSLFQSSLPFDDEKRAERGHKVRRAQEIVDEACRAAIRSGFDPKVIGNLLLELAEREDGVERSAALAAAIVKAKKQSHNGR